MPGLPMDTSTCFFFHTCVRLSFTAALGPLTTSAGATRVSCYSADFLTWGPDFYFVSVWNQPLPSSITGSRCVLPSQAGEDSVLAGLTASLRGVSLPPEPFTAELAIP